MNPQNSTNKNRKLSALAGFQKPIFADSFALPRSSSLHKKRDYTHKCEASHCNKIVPLVKYCRIHQRRMERHGSLVKLDSLKNLLHPSRKRGAYVLTNRGYKLVYMPHHPNAIKTGHIREHRLVIEKKT